MLIKIYNFQMGELLERTGLNNALTVSVAFPPESSLEKSRFFLFVQWGATDTSLFSSLSSSLLIISCDGLITLNITCLIV